MTSAFERLLADLSEAGVDYILVGGLAVAFCGHVRATEDVDILVQIDDENLARLLEVLAEFGEGSGAELQLDDFTLEEGAIRVIEGSPLDIFTQMSGYRYEDLESMTTTRHVNDHAIHHLNIEGLITLKEESRRDKSDGRGSPSSHSGRGGVRLKKKPRARMGRPAVIPDIAHYASRITHYATDAQAH